MSISTQFRLASLAVVAATAFVVAVPVSAQRSGRAHLSGTFANHQGGLTHVRAAAAVGSRGSAWRGGHTATGADGSVTHRAVRSAQGAGGGTYRGTNGYTLNADGSANRWHDGAGSTAAGGTVSRSGSYARSAGGNVSGSAQTSANGARGSYQASTSTADGITQHNTSITTAAGASYSGQTTYTRGEGVTYTGSCADADGNSVGCGDRVRRR
ncbi:hypothetical protein [Dyella sp.]|jgi:hypothetical protein|uniref:hypothetical protein n=1 Tax=Dyella sp. TaxID=1869338 RepID=UPI002D77DA8D|nr:hypothetical protein [Dyella sp.]HET6432420.1 hypothetical protein [Dyella sp.]